jgi:uncharacterized membrane protein YbhN (UPF0104 family)
MRRLILSLLKAAISILLLYLSFRSVNIGVVGERLSRIDASWLVLAFMLLAAQVVLLAARWREIARACGTPIAFGQALQISFIASFFNQVLPSTVGGDAARIWLLARQGGGWAGATYSVLIDRIVGVLVLALIVIACLPWTLDIIHDPIARAVLILIGCGALTGAVVFIAFGMTTWQPLLDRWMPTRHLAAASRAARRLGTSASSVATVAACSVAIHMLTVTVAWCCVKAVAAPVGFAQVLFLMPPVLLIATVPLSIAGWGVRESSMVVAFAYAGLAQGDGLILSILFGIVSFAVGAAGGLVWIASGLSMRAFQQARVRQASVSEP